VKREAACGLSVGHVLRPEVMEARKELYRGWLKCAGSGVGRKLLDVGCGTGMFMAEAGKTGWDVWGTEADLPLLGKAAVSFPGRVSQAGTLMERAFDVITLWDVLDCMTDPVGELGKLLLLLRPGGHIMIRVRNSFFHFNLLRLQTIMGMQFRFAPAVIHRFAFSGDTLGMVLDKTGFSGINISNSTLTPGESHVLINSLKKRAVGILKSAIYLSVQAVSVLTRGSILLGPSLTATACRPGKEERQ